MIHFVTEKRDFVDGIGGWGEDELTVVVAIGTIIYRYSNALETPPLRFV